MGSDCFWLTDDQFARLKLHLPTRTRGVPWSDDGRIISGIVHVLRSAGCWAGAPAVCRQRETLYNRYVRWTVRGVWRKLFLTLAAEARPPTS